MKNYWKFMLAAFAVLAAVSCAKQEMTDPDEKLENQETVVDGNLVPMSITVGSEGTKTDIADNLKSVVWCEDDKIAVFDAAGEIREFTVQPGSINGGTAVFEGAVLEGTTDYYAVYPYSAAVSCADGKVVATTMTEQVLEGGKVADGAIVAVGKSKVGQALQFKNVVGVMRMDLTYDDVTEIILDGAALAGTATFDPATGEIEEGTLASASNSVTLKPSGDVFAPGSYFVPLLPGTTAKDGFHMAMVRAEDKGAVHTATEEVAIPRNGGFFVQDTKLTESFVIKDAESLQTFLTKAKDYEAEQLATIVRDIDLTGVTLTPASDFAGVLNGAGHSLKNWTTNGPLFTKTSAGSVVKDFVLEASCNLNMKETDDKQAFVVATNAGTVSGITNKADIDYVQTEYLQSRVYGTIVGYSTGLVSDCHNEGDITLTLANFDYTSADASGLTYQHQRIGGVVGAFAVAEGTVGMKDCTNSGNLTYDIKGPIADNLRPKMVMGGVCGLIANNGAVKELQPKITTDGVVTTEADNVAVNRGTIEACRNSGEVIVKYADFKSSNYSNVAGVVGYAEGNVVACVNEETGKVLLDGFSSAVNVTSPSLGGVVATVVAGDVTGCSNAAPVEMNCYVGSAGSENAYTGGIKHASMGGIVGKAGDILEDADYAITDCVNTGELKAKINASSTVFMGGVVGYSSIPVVGTGTKTLTNDAPVVVAQGSTPKNVYAAGVVGYTISTLNKAYNLESGKVTVNLPSTWSSAFTVGGVAAYLTKAAAGTFKQAQNYGDITISGGKAGNTNTCYVGGCVGRAAATSITSNGTGWATCNTNYADIKVDSPSILNLGGVVGYTGKGSSLGTTFSKSSMFEKCKNGGNIEVANPADGSSIGGVIGYQYRGVLGNANSQGSTTYDNVSIKVTGATDKTYVGGYVGTMKTDHGINGSHYWTIALSGCSIRGSIDAQGASVGVVAGYLFWSGASTSNGLLLGSSESERPKISETFRLDGTVMYDATSKSLKGDINDYFAVISPSATTTKTGPDGIALKGIYLLFAKGNGTTPITDFRDGLQVVK